jgi:hypothetical protein
MTAAQCTQKCGAADGTTNALLLCALTKCGTMCP